MKGLILKDLLSVKSTFAALIFMLCIPLLICVLVAILGMSIAAIAIISVTAILGLMNMVIATNFGTYDESCGLDSFTVAFPVSRTKIVLARYCSNLLVMFFSSLIIFIVQIICFVSEGVPLTTMYHAVYIIFMLLGYAIINPIIYKFGAQIGGYIISGTIALLGLCVTAVGNILDENISDGAIDAMLEIILSGNNLQLVMIFGFAICVMLFVLSMLISILIYKRKDF